MVTSVPPAELFKFDMVVTSYNYLVAECGRVQKFRDSLRDYRRQSRKGKPCKLPKRPSLTLMSSIFDESDKCMGRFLVLDEAQTIKNSGGRTFEIVSVLRDRFDACLMLSGTPLDNTWMDSYALISLLRGHHITSRHVMQALFSEKVNGGRSPRHKYLVRLMQMMDACTLRRPHSVIASLLPPLTSTIVNFELDDDDLFYSNEAFKEFKKSLGPEKPPGAGGASSSNSGRTKQKLAGFASLFQAMQQTNHPKLIDIMAIERKSIVKNSIMQDVPDASLALDDDDEEALLAWRTELAQDRAWRSSRVDTIVDIVNRHRDWRTEDAFVVMDESVFFLDILDIAFTNMHEPLPCFRYDGRQRPAERNIKLEEFRKAKGARILLMSRAAGGVGLNIQAANVMIRCNVWWKKSWEEQADGRIHRLGQTRPVFIYELQVGHDCLVENYKKHRRDTKNALNSQIMDAVTRTDGQSTGVPRRCV